MPKEVLVPGVSGEVKVKTTPEMGITHLAATPIGMTVTAKSTVESIKGRRVAFAVEAYNEKEKIGEGTHERVIIQKSPFSKDSD